ncbi:IclR family transcriptional regulator [Nocardioides psychrotolerans]|uniref:Transcriptional regulator, IclR family n=1 Tax=Nocardioides psychrotolerans TaxID=1005945 RepID=A0A1I3ESW5_9ACTN|nr:IclR family transcriptional regulator [Nocardioides psychrotolerans]GEP39155.1 IclR family transcriptional regulator [Nocardioides psychrotolerans]SFI02067.1 transcriptional regulator, IclR family [Nocardioides psychrotolerans]
MTALVALVVRAQRPLTYSDLVAATGLPRSTVSRLLGALELGGLVERESGGAYRGGRLFADYAARFDRVEALVRVAHTHLEDLATQTGETVNLAVARGSDVVHVDQVDARFVIGSVNWVDMEVPNHCSALGKVMLAWGVVRPPSGRLERRTPFTVATHAALERDLEETLERGYALTRGELEEGLDGIAVPVHSGDGTVVAALGVSGPTFRIGDRRPGIAESLQTHAAAVAGDLAKHARST